MNENVEKMKDDFLFDLSELEQDTKKLLYRIRQAKKEIKKSVCTEDLDAINEEYGNFDKGLKFIRIFG